MKFFGKFFAVALAIALSAGCARRSNVKDENSYYDRAQTNASGIDKFDEVGQPKKRVTVFNFSNESPVGLSDFGRFAAEELRSEFKSAGKILLSKDVRLLKDTRDFVNGSNVRVPELVREGRQLGTGAIVVGRISKLVFRQTGDDVGLFREKESLAAAEIEVKVFDVSGAREILGVTRVGEASQKLFPLFQNAKLESPEFRKELLEGAIKDAIKQLVPEITKRVEKLTWQGRIARIVGQRVYLNAGREAGILRGDVLRVVTAGEEVYDPDSGAFLGETRGHLKGTLEIVDFLGDDASVASIHSGGNFKEGDLVKLY